MVLCRLVDANLSELDEEARALVRGQYMGFVFQSFQLLGSLTALENVMLPVELRGDRMAADQAKQLLTKGRIARSDGSLPAPTFRRRTTTGGYCARLCVEPEGAFC
jgi:putative ABC transport system ATP-binding protein